MIIMTTKYEKLNEKYADNIAMIITMMSMIIMMTKTKFLIMTSSF